MPPPSLEDLFRTFLATGDEAALAQWLRRSAPSLRAGARRLGADAEDAEDLVQETLVAAIHGAARWDPTRPLLPWLKGILTFKAAKLARDSARRPKPPVADGAGAVDALVGAAPPVVDELAGRELHGDVHFAIAQLPERYRVPLQQFLFAQRTPVEIAQGLGLERTTVRVHLHRGLARLRAMLQRWAGLGLLLVLGRTASASPSARTARGIAWLAAVAVVVWFAWPVPESLRNATAGPSLGPVAAVPGAVQERSAAGNPATGADPQRQPAAPPGLRLRVLAADGTPLPHTGASLTPAAGRDPVLHRRRAVSDANGFLYWPEATLGRWLAQLDRGPSRTFDLDADPVPAVHEIAVQGGQTVHGRVLAPDGTPVVGAHVWLGEGGEAWRGTDVCTTAADGTFLLRHVPRGALLAARDARFAGSEPAAAAPDGTCVLRLGEAGPRATVRVEDEAGAPVPDALVFVGDAADAAPVWLADGAAPRRPPPFEARTDAAGTMNTLALPALPPRLAVRAVGRVPFVGWLAPGPDGTHTVVLARGDTIAGLVRDEHGAPLAGVDVVHRSLAAGSDVDLVSDAHGRFVFEGVGQAGNEVAARAIGRIPTACTVPAAAPGTTSLFELVLPAARMVRARVRDAEGRAVAGELRATWPESQLDPAPRIAPLDGDGSAVVANGRDGTPRLAFRPAGEPLWRDVDAFAVWHGDDVAVALPTNFAADGWLAGNLRTSDGRPLRAARLFVHRDGVQWAELGRSDVAGAFRLGPLPAGRYVLFAETTDPGLPTFVADPVDLAAATTAVVDATTAPCGRVDLTFVWPDTANAGDLVVTLVDAVRRRRCAVRTGPHLDQVLLPGDYEAYVMGSRIAWQEAIPVHVDAGTTTTLQVPLRAGLRVTFAPIGLPPSDAGARTFVLCDHTGAAVGTWSLPPDHSLRMCAVLAPGRYELRQRATDGAGWAGGFEVRAGGPDGFVIAMQPR
ncbi:MAG: sigma-70 family RNA polymerase sigma factor [Planctomycetes bacterium]|nr:sigma-70 family RNA polymerase sigma factor [Planctomycetota bacterium]